LSVDAVSILQHTIAFADVDEGIRSGMGCMYKILKVKQYLLTTTNASEMLLFDLQVYRLYY